MAMSECSRCGRTEEIRSMSSCGLCGARLCDVCARECHGLCDGCASEEVRA